MTVVQNKPQRVARPYRVVQWATGNIGKRSLRAVIEHPNLSLVGLYVHSETKAGRDAGELCGLDAVGVKATRSIDAIIALEADCVLYMQQGCNFDELYRLLASGANVVTTRSEFNNPASLDPAVRARIEDACRLGHSSIHSTGISPGFITEAVPLVLTSIQRRLDSVHIHEFADVSSRNSPNMLFQVMGFGQPPMPQADQARAQYLGKSFGPSLQLLANALGLPLDSIVAQGEVATARRDVHVAAGVIEGGTVAAQRTTISGMRKGKPLVSFSANWYCSTDIHADWDLRATGWHVEVEGDTPLDIEIRCPVPAERWAEVSPNLTAHRPLDEILNLARATTGLADPEQDSWREGLALLLRDHAKADTLTERGRHIMKARYSEALATRMRVDDYIRHHPQVTKVPVKRPLFILGIPRSGTTLASYLLDADPANRSLLKWEAYNGTPPAAPGALRTDPRCLAEKAKDATIIQANPQGAAQHFEAGDGPTECVHLLAQDFKSLMFAVLSTTPSYHDWILFCDMLSAFAHRKRVLQILQSTNPGRWVLKMPSDAIFIRTLFATFPDAKVIWTHRDPYATFASSMSMRGHSRPIFNKDADVGYMRERFPLQLALHLARPLEMSRERPEDIYDLYYDDLVADPLAQMKKIYAWLGDPWTAATDTGMRAYLRDNPQGRFGQHRYSLSQWGFTKQDLEPYFSDDLRAQPVATSAES